MYQVVKDNVAFYVQDEKTALKYAEDGYDVFLRTKLKVGDDGSLHEYVPKSTVTGVGVSATNNIPERR